MTKIPTVVIIQLCKHQSVLYTCQPNMYFSCQGIVEHVSNNKYATFRKTFKIKLAKS